MSKYASTHLPSIYSIKYNITSIWVTLNLLWLAANLLFWQQLKKSHAKRAQIAHETRATDACDFALLSPIATVPPVACHYHWHFLLQFSRIALPDPAHSCLPRSICKWSNMQRNMQLEAPIDSQCSAAACRHAQLLFVYRRWIRSYFYF